LPTCISDYQLLKVWPTELADQHQPFISGQTITAADVQPLQLERMFN
jgi:hypothetical protein